jgi:ketosteroid isomerase-like protein
MFENPNVITLMSVLDAFNRGDIDAVVDKVDPDVVYFVRGRSQVSGTYHGPHELADVLRRIKELTGGSMSGTPDVVLADGDNVMMYVHVTGARPDGRTYDNHQAYLYRFLDGKLIEGQTIPVDQHAFEEFLAD